MATLEAVVPNEYDKHLAEESSRELARISQTEDPVDFVVNGDDQVHVILPSVVVRLLKDLLTVVARGEAVTVVSTEAEITTAQAAEVLNVSRPYLIKLLDSHKIDFHRVGTHRRIKFADLMDYKTREDEARRKVLRELAELDKELGL